MALGLLVQVALLLLDYKFDVLFYIYIYIGLSFGDLSFIFFSADTSNQKVPTNGSWILSPGLICCARALVFKPDPFPGLPGSAVAAEGHKSTDKTGA